jgi:hypothetical protein
MVLAVTIDETFNIMLGMGELTMKPRKYSFVWSSVLQWHYGRKHREAGAALGPLWWDCSVISLFLPCVL